MEIAMEHVLTTSEKNGDRSKGQVNYLLQALQTRAIISPGILQSKRIIKYKISQLLACDSFVIIFALISMEILCRK